MGDLNELVERLTKEAALGNNVYSPWPQKMLSEAAAALTSLIAERDGLREALTDIAAMTDPDDPESYRSDDREGCLDTVQAVARTTLSLDTNKGDGV